MTIIKEIQEISDKAVKYDNLKNRYIEAVKKIEEAQQLLSESIYMLDAAKSIKRNRSERINHDEKLDEQYNKMKMGLYISTKFLEKDYPELDKRKILTLYMKIKSALNVSMRRRDDNIRELYIQKEG